MILNIFDNKYNIPVSFLNKVASSALGVLGAEKDIIINLSFVSGGKIRELNKKYRGENLATDVLSFKADFDSPHFLGDILICYSVAKQQAKEYNRNIENEVALLLIHGILHLFGFDHKTKKEATKLKEKEKEILGNLKIK